MEEKIKALREKLIQELSQVENGVHVRLDYDSRILDLLLFRSEGERESRNKKFALPESVLKKIDFSNVSFDYFFAEKYDFSNLYGVKLNPQTLCGKILSHTKLKGVEFIGPFDGARIEGADFTGSIGARIDAMKLYIEPSNYSNIKKHNLEDCKFFGVTFLGGIGCRTIQHKRWDGEKTYEYHCASISGADFTGSHHAFICVRDIHPNTGLYNCILRDTFLVGDVCDKKFNEIPIQGANFSGAKVGKKNIFREYVEVPNAKIRFTGYKIYNNDLSNVNFDGVEFLNPIGESIIEGANFAGSTGAVIDLRQIKGKYDQTNFSHAKVIGFDGKEMFVFEDGRIGKDIEATLDKMLHIEYQTSLIERKNLEDARKELVEENRRRLQTQINELLSILRSSEILGVNPKNLYASIPIDRELFFVRVGDHFEINRNLVDLSLLRFFNLSLIDFTNVKVSGVDFRYSGAKIDPQKVYQKDLSYATFDAGNLSFFDDFAGVNIEGTDFSECDFDRSMIARRKK